MIDGDVTPDFRLDRGVPQGAVLSPILYAIYINGVVSEFAALQLGVAVAGIKVACLLFADDLVLIADSPGQLRLLLRILQDYALLWQFAFNAAKSGIMVVGDKSGIKERTATLGLSLGGVPIPIVTKYDYLGIDFTENRVYGNRWSEMIAAKAKAAHNEGKSLLWFARRCGMLHSPGVLALWKSKARTSLEYGAALWGPTLTAADANALEVVQHTFGRNLLDADTVSNEFVRDELGLQLLSSRRLFLVAQFWASLCRADQATIHNRLFRWRCDQVDKGRAKLSWCTGAFRVLKTLGLSSAWRARSVPADWKQLVSDAVERVDSKQLTADFGTSEALRFRQPRSRDARSLRAAPYLTNVLDPRGVRLLCQTRAGTLQLADMVGKIMQWPDSQRLCTRCAHGLRAKEDVFHFVALCPAYRDERAAFRADVRAKLPEVQSFASDDAADWFRWLVTNPDGIRSKLHARLFDAAARIFIKKLWAKRLKRAGVFTARRSGSKGVLSLTPSWSFLAPAFASV